MKKKILFITLWGIFLFSVFPILNAQEEGSSDKGLKWSGYFQTDNRLLLKNGNNFSWKEYRLDLKAEVTSLEKVHFYSEIWVRSLGFSNVQNFKSTMQIFITICFGFLINLQYNNKIKDKFIV